MSTEQFQADITRPYLVIPKLVEQPTWGGEYIATAKGWENTPELAGKKIGQSYELFSGSNLSLCASSDDPEFTGELTDRDAVRVPSRVPNSVPLAELIEFSPEGLLGAEIAAKRGADINLLIKFTQAQGNSFQVHLRDGQTDAHWVPKLESWYYFEPGLLTFGIKKDANWEDYQAAVTAVDAGMRELSEQMKTGRLSYEDAKLKAKELVEQYDPWQFVNLVEAGRDDLIDLSAGGIHHSWEEDIERFPLGNVVYEVQNEAMDDVSTLRSFDRGKIGADGAVRDVHIAEYFRLIDRSLEANDPRLHMGQATVVETGERHKLVQLLESSYYDLGKLTLSGEGAEYRTQISQFAHLFVKLGRVVVSTKGGEVLVGAGHACFIPAAAGEYIVRSESPETEVLITK